MAGWQVGSGIGLAIFTGAGMFILVRDPDALELQKVFAKFEITLQKQVMPEGPRLRIFVGSKGDPGKGVIENLSTIL